MVVLGGGYVHCLRFGCFRCSRTKCEADACHLIIVCSGMVSNVIMSGRLRRRILKSATIDVVVDIKTERVVLRRKDSFVTITPTSSVINSKRCYTWIIRKIQPPPGNSEDVPGLYKKRKKPFQSASMETTY